MKGRLIRAHGGRLKRVRHRMGEPVCGFGVLTYDLRKQRFKVLKPINWRSFLGQLGEHLTNLRHRWRWEAQRRSFAFGNVSMHNPAVTREVVDDAAERLRRAKLGP